MALSPVTRNISGKGIIQIPDEYEKAREILLYVDLLRPPTSEYQNYQWNPSKTFYGHVTFCKDEYVLLEYDVNFASQVFTVHASQSSQNLIAQICALEDILNSFVQYATASGFVYFKNNSIKNYPYQTFLPNIIRFYCYTDCALRLHLAPTELVKCSEDAGQPSPPPPPPPPPPPLVPPGTPIEVSPPYDGQDDDGDTVPNPIDEDPVPPPFGNQCQSYTVTYSFTAVSGGNSNRIENQIIRLWGEIGGIRTTIQPDGDPEIQIECRGLEEFSNPCEGFEFRGVQSLSGAGSSVEFVDATIDNIS